MHRTPSTIVTLSILLLAGLIAGACRPTEAQEGDGLPTLKQAFENDFLVGAALNPSHYRGENAVEANIVKQQFNSITAENVMKWEVVHPEPGEYDFEEADAFVEFGEENDMFVVGHTLVWHSQTPRWVFEDEEGNPASRELLLGRMRDHIQTVVGRYKGRVAAWDVVNEALNEDGSLRESPWLRIIGEDYIAKAFEYAHEADPEAELYYNDYSLANAPKREGAVRIAQNLLDQGVSIHGVGLQGHYNMTWPTQEELAASIQAFTDLGIDAMITELDVDVLPSRTDGQSADISERGELSDELNPYPDALPDSMQQALADRYAALFDVLVDHKDQVSRVTFWGVTDGGSWKNNFPIPGRTNYPLLFGRDGEPKPAFEAVLNTARR